MNMSWLALVPSLFFQSEFEVSNQQDFAKLTLVYKKGFLLLNEL